MSGRAEPPSNMSGAGALEIYIGFRAGVYERARVADWVDAQVLASDGADGPLLELAVLRDKSDIDIDALLLDLARETHGVDIGRHAFATLGRMVRAQEMDGDRASRTLIRLPQEWFSEGDAEHAHDVDDAYHLAASGAWGTLEEARERLLEFTDQFEHSLSNG